ncbi:MAG: AAA family ATPase [Myxococcales bacterium]|nr:AAA family ATPase [Myxococcales bacterium]
MARLVVFGGLPGAGKSTLSLALARAIGAVHLRIDTIEQALRDAGVAVRAAEGYAVACAVAADQLALGHTVITDAVNPIAYTRAMFRAVGERSGAPVIEVEVVCSDRDEHRRRVETRTVSVAGLRLPTWEEVVRRDYEPWEGALMIDTAGEAVAASLAKILAALGG